MSTQARNAADVVLATLRIRPEFKKLRRLPTDGRQRVGRCVRWDRLVRRLLRPARSVSRLVIGAARDLTRTRSELLAENALLRQQVIVLRRNSERRRLHRDDRLLLLVLALIANHWRESLHLISPETERTIGIAESARN